MSQVDITNGESSDLPNVAQALPDHMSKAFSASTTLPEIPILEDYPPEILTMIFSHVKQDEINLHSRNLAPYYLPMKHRYIDVVTEFIPVLPKLMMNMLPFYLEAEWFRPETLRLNRIEEFRTYPSHLLKKIKSVHICCPIIEKEDYERLYKMENISVLTISSGPHLMRMKSYPIPKSVAHLEIYEAEEDIQIPSLRTLKIYGGQTWKSWPQLKKLVLGDMVIIDFLVKFPMSLVHLDVHGTRIPEYTNLNYLNKLRTLRIGLIKNVELPNTIRDLSCGIEVDFTQFHHLEYVDVYGGHGFFSFPETIRSIRLSQCEIYGLGNLSELSKLEYLYMVNGDADLRVLEVEYPHCLKEISLDGVSLFFLKTGTRFLIRRNTISNIVKCNLKSLDLVQDTNVSSIEVIKAIEALRTTIWFNYNTAPHQLRPNLLVVYIGASDIELSSSFFLGSNLTKFWVTGYKVHVSSPVQLPSTLRELSITACELTSEMWSNFICPLKLKILDLLKNKLTEFVECPPELKMLNLLDNSLTEFVEYPSEVEVLDLLDNNLSGLGAINPSITRVELRGNKLYAEAIPGYRTLVPLSKELSPKVPTEELMSSFMKIEEIGFAYHVYTFWSYSLVISKNGIQRFEAF